MLTVEQLRAYLIERIETTTRRADTVSSSNLMMLYEGQLIAYEHVLKQLAEDSP